MRTHPLTHTLAALTIALVLTKDGSAQSIDYGATGGTVQSPAGTPLIGGGFILLGVTPGSGFNPAGASLADILNPANMLSVMNSYTTIDAAYPGQFYVADLAPRWSTGATIASATRLYLLASLSPTFANGYPWTLITGSDTGWLTPVATDPFGFSLIELFLIGNGPVSQSGNNTVTFNGDGLVFNATPSFTSPSSYAAIVGVAFSGAMSASGSTPITFTASNLPAGLTNSTNGMIAGTPTTAGTNAATLIASNAFGVTNQAATFVIAKGTPVITTWPTAPSITYGQALSNSALSGGAANVAGSFAWAAPANLPNAGSNTATVTFTPSDAANYNTVATNVVVLVNKATPVVSNWPTASPLYYGQELGSSVLSGGAASVAGSFAWSTPTVTPPIGTNSYTVTFIPQDSGNYNAVSTEVAVSVALNPTGDEDNDGLNNTEEANLGTNPYLRDTDNDGVNDQREVGDSTDPLDPASFEPLNLGLVAYYPFDGNAKDESGNSLNATIYNPANTTLADDRFSTASSAYQLGQAQNGVDPGLWGTGIDLAGKSMTISFWAYGQFSQAMDDYVGVGVGTLPPGSYNPGGTAGNNLAIYANWERIRFSFFYNDLDAASSALAPNKWNHLSFTYDEQSRVRRILVNGKVVASDVAQYGFSGTTVFAMGGRNASMIDDVRFYNRALRVDEIASLYADETYAGFVLEGAATKSPFDPATAPNWSAGGTAWTVDTTVTHDGVDSVKAQTTDGQSTYREYTVTGPAVVDFWWKVSSEELYDTFSWSVNGVNQQTISGEVDWTYRTLTLPAGTHTIRWTYTKDESGAVGQDAGWLDDFVVYPATATLQVRDGSTVLDDEATVDFGSADTGSTGFTKSLTFANDGYVPLEVPLSLPDGSPFSFDDGGATYELLLGRGESVDVPIVLSTAGAGTKTAQLTISAPDSTVIPPSVTLTGYVRGPDIGLAQGATILASGQTFDMGLAPRTVEFTIRNNGNVGDLVIAGISATGNFQITQLPAATIPPQTSTTFKVLAQSVASGVQVGSVSIASNAANLAEFSLPLSSKSLVAVPDGVTDGSMATSGTGGAVGWDFATTVLPSGQSGSALKTGATPNSGGSVLEFTSQTAGVVSWSWKVSTQENFDWLLCEVDGQETAGISTKNGVWQTQVVQVPAGANVRWVYRKDASGTIGEDAGYLADVEFRSFAANQSFSQWAQTHGIYDPQQRMPKSGLQAMFGWLGGLSPSDPTGDWIDDWVPSPPDSGPRKWPGLPYRYPVSKTADGTQQILYSSDMSSWTTRRISQRIVSEDADRVVIEATAPSGTKGFFKVVGEGDTSMVWVGGGTLPQASELAGTEVATFQIGRTEVTWSEWQEVRDWAVANGYSDLAGVGEGSTGHHPVTEVNWYHVVKWCNAKSEREGLAPVYQVNGAVYRTGQSLPTVSGGANGFRLPAEAEWEWAARGGLLSRGYTYSGSNDLNAVAWYAGNSGYSGKVVGTKAANELGIHDMSGNVWEWCEDVAYGNNRLLRGGSWAEGADYCAVVRGHDVTSPPESRYREVGFRLTRNAD